MEDKQRNDNGQFLAGHAYMKPKEANRSARARVKMIQSQLLDGMSELILEAPNYIKRITDPEKKIGAIAKIMPFCMPSLSHVDLDDQTQRDISIEMKLKEFKVEQAKQLGNNN